jgi:uncharacterized protein YdaU (DUF1376 family)
MSSLPYLPLFVDDFEADTAHLSFVEDGIYNRILRLCWRSPKCRLPNDQDWVARKIRVVTEEERQAMAAVISEFFTARRGYIFSKRLSAEFERISASVERRKQAGKSGGLAKSMKTKGSGSSNARPMLKHPEPEPYKKTNVFSNGADARKKSKMDEFMEAFSND